MYPLLNPSEEDTSVSNDELEDSWFYPESITGREGELSPLMNAPIELFNEVKLSFICISKYWLIVNITEVGCELSVSVGPSEHGEVE